MNKITSFLINNGFKEEKENDPDYRLFLKDGCIGISLDMEEKEIVLLNDHGDFLHLPFNYFALLGALFHYRQIAIDYTK
jgi:hypothetical protein